MPEGVPGHITAISHVIKEKYKTVFAVSLLLLLCAGAFELVGLGLLIPLVELAQQGSIEQPSSVTRLFTSLLSYTGLQPSLLVTLLVIICVICLKSTVLFMQKKYAHNVLMLAELDFKKSLFESYVRSSWLSILQSSNALFMNALTNEIRKNTNAVMHLTVLTASVIDSFVYLGVALFLAWQAVLIAGIVVLLLIFPFRALIQATASIWQQVVSLNSRVQATVLETILGLKFIKSTNQTRPFEKLFFLHNKDRAKKEHAAYVFKICLDASREPVSIIVAAALIFVCIRILNIGLESILVLAFVVSRLYGKVITVAANINNFKECIPSFEMCSRMLQEAEAGLETSGSKIFHGLSSGIHFQNVCFSYNDKTQVFDGLTLEIPKGSTVAFVGKSGCGKTTAVDLITGLLRPDSGRIVVDGTSLLNIDLASYRNRIGFVPQEPFLINASIRDNICLHGPGCSYDEVKKAAATAYAEEFILNMPEGYDTSVGDRGAKLSGGQKQRIALARALLRKPDILILDEATSALDNRSELCIKRALDQLKGRFTIITIAHRLSTIENADHIYSLAEGKARKITYAECRLE